MFYIDNIEVEQTHYGELIGHVSLVSHHSSALQKAKSLYMRNAAVNLIPIYAVDEVCCAQSISSHHYQIEEVIFNDPATIVYWNDGTKTVVKCQEGDTFDKERGLLLCIAKKMFDNRGKFNDILREYIKEDT